MIRFENYKMTISRLLSYARIFYDITGHKNLPVPSFTQEMLEVPLGDAPLTAELVGLQLTTIDPAADGLLIDVEPVGNFMDSQQGACRLAGLLTCRCSHFPCSSWSRAES